MPRKKHSFTLRLFRNNAFSGMIVTSKTCYFNLVIGHSCMTHASNTSSGSFTHVGWDLMRLKRSMIMELFVSIQWNLKGELSLSMVTTWSCTKSLFPKKLSFWMCQRNSLWFPLASLDIDDQKLKKQKINMQWKLAFRHCWPITIWKPELRWLAVA